MNDNKAMERAEIVEALRSISTGHALNNDLCMEIGWRTVCCLAADLLERDVEPPNDPLTLEELRGMDGEPVWAGNEKEPQYFQWFLVDCGSAYKPFILINRHNNLMWQYMKSPAHPHGWTAYRRKPDGGVE